MALSKYSESLNATDNDNRGTFHIRRGQDVDLSEGKTVAQVGGEWMFYYPGTPQHVRADSVPTKIFVRRLVFTSKPIEVGETFQVHVTRRKHIKPGRNIIFAPGDHCPKRCYGYPKSTDVQQNIATGFIAYDPARLLVIPEDSGIADSYQHSPDVWMLSEDKVYHDGRKEAKHNLCVYQPDSNTIGCRVNEKGCLEFIMDGKNHGVVWSKPLPMDRPLWGFVDLPIEYKIQACFTYGLGPPPPYKPSVDQNPDPQSDTNQRLEQKIADLEAIIQKNSQEMQHMQQELASNFQKQLMDMQQQFQAQLNRLESSVQNLKP